MRKKILIWSFVLCALLAGSVVIPRMVQSTIPSNYYVTPNSKTYENVIQCTGVIQPERTKEVRLDSNVVVGSVYVRLGDIISEGDTLAFVDLTATEAINSRPSDLIEHASDNLSINADQVSAFLSAYGLSAFINNGSIDPNDIMSQISDQSKQNVLHEKTVPVSEIVAAPSSGIITEINLQKDTILPANTPAVVIIDPYSYKAIVSVNESDISKIQTGDQAKVRGVGFGGKTYDGTITSIAPTAHKVLNGASSETVVDVEVSIKNPDNSLKPGFSTKVEITGGNFQHLITVPYEAIRQDENNDEYVYTYENGKIKKALVVTGQELINEVEILSGLTSESIVIYNPDSEIKEGAMVNIKGRADVD